MLKIYSLYFDTIKFIINYLIYKYSDLSGLQSLKHKILESFSSSSEEVKSAASYTLGNTAVGNLMEYLPFILQEIEAQPKRGNLLKEVIKLI